MEVTEEKAGDILTVRLIGRLNESNSGCVEKRLLELIRKGESRFALDLSRLDYINSMGLRVLIMAVQRLGNGGGKIVAFAPTKSVQQVIDVSGVGSLLRSVPTREEAMREVGGENGP